MIRLFFGLIVFVLMAVSCGEDESASGRLEGESCVTTSECVGGLVCDVGVCSSICTPSCERPCGDNGCGGSCGVGECPASAPFCTVSGCSDQCTPNCGSNVCGDDGCGGSCGICSPTEPYCANGACVAECTPDCAGKECGPDGCGATCGTCESGLTCQTAIGVCASATFEEATMEGRVTRADGSPLADVEVSIGTQTTETDSSGRYKVIGLQPGPTTIKAERDLYMGFEAELNLFSGVNELDITLRGESRLIGRITDAATGNGVPAEVSVGFTASTANGNGDFRIEGLVAGNFVVTVTAAGYGRETRSATLDEGVETSLEVELRRAGEVVGTVTNETGTGLSGAVVSTPGAVAVSDMLGSYRLENVQAGLREITVFKAGFDPKVLTLNVTSGTAITQNVVLAPVGPGTYRGKVTSVDSGMALAGVQVRLNVGGTRTTDQSGDFEFVGLDSGLYTATFTADGFVTKSGSVVVQSGATTNRNERLKETRTCVVQVMDATTGITLVGASVLGGYEDGALGYALSYPFIANAGINGVASSSCPFNAVITWRVSLTGYYYLIQPAVVSVGNTSFSVQLTSHPVLHGKATSTGGLPEPNAAVAIVDANGNVMGTSSTLPNGDFEVKVSGSGSFTLFVSKPGFESAVRSVSVPYTGTLMVNVELQRP